MKHNSLEIAIVSVSSELYDVYSASELTGIHPDIIQEFEHGKFVERSGADNDGSPLFDESGICRLRILSDLREREKLSLRMIRVFCQLMDQLERAESEVRELRNLQK